MVPLVMFRIVILMVAVVIGSGSEHTGKKEAKRPDIFLLFRHCEVLRTHHLGDQSKSKWSK